VKRRPIAAALIACGFLNLTILPVRAGPCGDAIAQFEQDVHSLATNPSAGPTTSQSIGAQLHRQPTGDSVRRAQDVARTTLNETLARAKALDAEGKQAECMNVLSLAKHMFNFP
jgi:hypothetical protein